MNNYRCYSGSKNTAFVKSGQCYVTEKVIYEYNNKTCQWEDVIIPLKK